MKTLNVILTALAAAAAAFVPAAAVSGQYYTPLRYDLRYTSPTYIPSGTMRFGPSGPNPYAFGSPLYSDLSVTGNLRAGKSFHGNVPYTQSGSQISTNLGTNRLSNFTRDSIGVGDLGTGVEYGAPMPYYAPSGSVTNIGTAQQRFVTPPPGSRAPYTVQNPNAIPAPPPPSLAGSYYGPSAIPAERTVTGVARTPDGLYVPRSALEWVNALIEGRAAAPRGEGPWSNTEQTDPRDRRLAVPRETLPDTRPGGQTEPGQATRPSAEPARPGETAPPDSFEASQSALYWQIRERIAREKAAATTPGTPVPSAPAPGTGEAPPRAKTASTGGPDEEPIWPDDRFEEPRIPMTPDRYTPAVGYAEYVTRANAAMKEPSFGKAEALYAAAMTMDPDRPAALFGRIHALLADYRYLEADLILERALKAHPEWARDAPDLRAVYVKAGVYDRIVENLREELKRRPGHVPSGLVLGYVLYASGQYDEAKSLLAQVAATRPEAPGPEKVLLEAIEAAAGAKPAKP